MLHGHQGQGPYNMPPMQAYQQANMPPPQQQQQQQPPPPGQQQQQQPPQHLQQQQQQARSGGAQSNGQPESISLSRDGKKYKLEVIQEPIRARMCGFGDKDRRPITPPPCIRLVVIDEKTGQECAPDDFDVNFFILTVDLWDETGQKEVNLVRHSATSPSISAATSSSYPPPSAPVYPYSANTAAAASAHSVAAAQATGMQVHVGMTSPAYGPGHFGAHHAAPYMSQPPNGSPAGHPGAPPPPGMAPYQPQDPVNGGSRPQEPQSYYVSQTGQPTGAVNYGGYGMPTAPGGYPTQMNMLSPPQHAAPMDPRSAPSGMFTRNLIGSLAVNGNLLKDTASKPGIWFILQDLSVRTEGIFRLKMQFCCVADPLQKNTLNRGSAPILASTYSTPFQVYSAKKFPGVIESTPLSKCFAMQGVKIPIRKDGPTGKAADVDEDGQD